MDLTQQVDVVSRSVPSQRRPPAASPRAPFACARPFSHTTCSRPTPRYGTLSPNPSALPRGSRPSRATCAPTAATASPATRAAVQGGEDEAWAKEAGDRTTAFNVPGWEAGSLKA
ncbi:hypothetical protein G3M48_004814 [Beauveria asiatica]|uniref:Uncharacterized protein n=1 Tax=Beauveria asiatica TaxID=1069075 RepID=A0AAW0RSP9_9HYPO